MRSKVLMLQWFIVAGFIVALSDGAELPRELFSVTVEVRTEAPEADVSKLRRPILACRQVGEALGVRRGFELNEPQTIELPAGKYEFYAKMGQPLYYEAFGSLTVPRSDRITLLLKEIPARSLNILVVDEKQMPVPGCRLKLSFARDVKKHGVSKFASTGLSHASETTDDKGLCSIEFTGRIPKAQIELVIFNQELQLIGPRIVKADEWQSAKPFVVRVRRKKFNGKIPFYIQTVDKQQSFLQGVPSFGKGALTYARVKLSRVTERPGHPTHYDVRFSDDDMPLYGITDGTFYINKMSLSCSEGWFDLYPLGNNLLTIEKGQVVSPPELVFAKDVKEPFTVQLTCDSNPVAGARISLARSGFWTTTETDVQGRAEGLLPLGTYALKVEHPWHQTLTGEVVLDKDSSLLSLEMVAWPVIAGKATCSGKPVAEAQIRVLFAEDTRRIRGYGRRTSSDDTFRFPLKGTGAFLLGIRFEGFVEYRELNTTSDDLTSLQITLTPRVQTTLALTGKHRAVLDSTSTIAIFHVDNKALAATCRLNEAAKYEIAAIPGRYLVVGVTGEKVYDLGQVSVPESQGTVVIDMATPPRVLGKKTVDYLQKSGRLK